jgi:hypothetical protein
MPKPTKTESELQAMIMDELRRHPECGNVDAVAITHPLDRPWDVLAIRSGASLKPECEERIREITDRLCAQYDLRGQ